MSVQVASSTRLSTLQPPPANPPTGERTTPARAPARGSTAVQNRDADAYQPPRSGTPTSTQLQSLDTRAAAAETTAPTLDQVRKGAILRRGMTGQGVSDVQKLLGAKGFSTPVTGTYDQATENTVKRFQGANNIQQNGMVGPTTLGALERPNVPGVTPEQLRRICPTLSTSKANEVAPNLNRAMAEAGINTPRRQAAFIAQLAHESGEFKYREEIASGAAYEGRRDLGNVYPGDGVRFKGRGYIQLTGRSNYTAAGKALGLDLVNNPGLAATPENAGRIAAWFWNSRGLSTLADQGNFDEITRRINGGYNGKSSRDRYYRQALSVLGA